MTPGQRAALLDLCAAVLRCDCATPQIRTRAHKLRIRVTVDGVLASIFA